MPLEPGSSPLVSTAWLADHLNEPDLRIVDVRWRAREVLAGLYTDAGVTPDRDIIAYCGRGYAAARGLLALTHLGYDRVRMYDGCRAEWSADPDLPLETQRTGI